MNRKKSILTAVVLLLVILIGGMIAYFTDTESITNKFTLGNVDITLTEPNWSTTDSNNNGVPDVAEQLSPGQTIAKNPTVTVESTSKSAYLFMTVEIPAITTGVGGDVTKELFTYTTKTGWTEVTAKKSVKAKSVVHLYVYGTLDTPTTAAADTTTAALFDNVTVNTELTSAETESFSNNSNIIVTAYGIQIDGITASGAANIFNLFGVTL